MGLNALCSQNQSGLGGMTACCGWTGLEMVLCACLFVAIDGSDFVLLHTEVVWSLSCNATYKLDPSILLVRIIV